jgi:hypothetical protein
MVSALATTPAQARVRLGARYGEPEPKPARPSPRDPADSFTWGVGARAGYFGGLLFGEGLEAFRRIGAWHLGLAGYYGAADLTSALASTDSPALDGFSVEHARLRVAMVQVEGRHAAYGPFDARLGIGYRRATGSVALEAEDGTGRWHADADAASVILSAALGTYWTWENGLYLGVDWIGINAPVASSHRVTTTSDPTVAESSRTRLAGQADDLAHGLAEAPGLILLLAALGYRF